MILTLEEFQRPRSEIARPYVSDFVVRDAAHRLRQTTVLTCLSTITLRH